MLDFYFVFFALLAWDQAPQWGEKEKRGQIGKISASEASPAVVWGGKSGQTSLGSLPTRRYLFSFFPQCEAWSQAIALLSIQVPIGALSFFLTFFLFPFLFFKKMQMGIFFATRTTAQLSDFKCPK